MVATIEYGFDAAVKRLFALIAVFISALLVPSISVAQEAPPSLELSLFNPGARSMALGGAFVALADDATAAFANPAGLVQLLRPEVSLELRRRNYETPYTGGGRASGAPTGWGIDTFDGLRTELSQQSTSGVSYLSFVYPGTKWSIALFRHQMAAFTFGSELNGLFGEVPGEGTQREEDQRTQTDLDVVGTGLSGAYQVSEKLSLGFGITYFTGMIENRGEVYLIDSDPDTFWESNSFLPERQFAISDFDVDDSDARINFGFLWKFAESWRLGGVYRQGPRFDYDLVNRAGPAHWEPEGSIVDSVTDRSIALPDVWGLGVAFRSPNGSVTVGFEWDRVEYSVILESLESPLTDTSLVAVDDADELHLGLEYVFLDTSPIIAVRGGVWYDPDHRFRFIGDDPFDLALYPAGEDSLHFSVGFGIALNHFQIDIGADFSDGVDQFAISGILSF